MNNPSNNKFLKETVNSLKTEVNSLKSKVNSLKNLKSTINKIQKKEEMLLTKKQMLNNINNKHFTNLSTIQYKRAIVDTHAKQNADILTQMNKTQIDKLKEIGIKPSEVPSQLLKSNTSNPNNKSEQITPKNIFKYDNLKPFIYMGKCMEDKVPSGILSSSPTQLNNTSKRVFLLNDGRLVIDHNFGDFLSLQKVTIKKEGNKLVNLQNNTKGKKGFVFILDLTFSHENSSYNNKYMINKRVFNNRKNTITLNSMTNEQMNKLKESKIELKDIPNQLEQSIMCKAFKKKVSEGKKPYIYMGKLAESENTLKTSFTYNFTAGNNLKLTEIDKMVFLKPNGDFVINKKIPGILPRYGIIDFDQIAKLIYENDEPKKNGKDFIF